MLPICEPVFPFGIYAGDKLVGFMMVGHDIFRNKELHPKCSWFIKDSYIIWRLMIDKKYQNKGYGKEAVKEAYKNTKGICILSPAASSYNEYKNFEEKGRHYKELIKKYGE